jgi:hypothetical protein
MDGARLQRRSSPRCQSCCFVHCFIKSPGPFSITARDGARRKEPNIHSP